MAVATNIPVQDVLALAGRIQQQAGQLESQLSALRSACQREANFRGSASDNYDSFLAKWDASQRTLLESIRGAGHVLQQLGDVVQQNNDTAAVAFDN